MVAEPFDLRAEQFPFLAVGVKLFDRHLAQIGANRFEIGRETIVLFAQLAVCGLELLVIGLGSVRLDVDMVARWFNLFEVARGRFRRDANGLAVDFQGGTFIKQ